MNQSIKRNGTGVSCHKMSSDSVLSPAKRFLSCSVVSLHLWRTKNIFVDRTAQTSSCVAHRSLLMLGNARQLFSTVIRARFKYGGVTNKIYKIEKKKVTFISLCTGQFLIV